MNYQNFLLLGLALVFTLAMFPMPVSATYTLIPNGSFETGDNTDYNAISSSDVKLNSYLITNGSANRTFTPVDGNFFYVYNWNKTGSGSRPVEQVKFCSINKIINPNKVVDLNLYLKSAGWISTESNTMHDNVGNSSYIEFLYAYISPTPNISIYNLTTGAYTYSSSMRLTWSTSSNGYVTGTMTNGASASHLCFIIGSNDVGAFSFAFTEHDYVMLDKIQIQVNPTLINTITTDALPRSVLESGYIYVTVKDSLGNTLTNTDANVKVNFNSGGYQNATWDASIGKYKYLVSSLGQGTYTYDVNTSKSGGYVSDLDTAKVWTVAVNPTDLDVTCISNCTPTVSNSGVSFGSVNNSSDVIWKVVNGNGFSVDANYSWSNSDKSGSQYFIYTSTDGVSWTFSDTLTFGSTNSTPVQKIWNASTDTYDYSFSNSAVAGTTQYYKLVFQPLPIFWEVLKDSVDWANYNSPTSFSQSSGNHFYDLFADSNLSNIQSFTYKPYPQLTSTDLSAGFYVEFTGYASVASSLKVGYRVGSIDTVSGTVSLTTSPHRFAVFVQPNSNSAQILIKSISNTSANVYLSDYAIVPASYFVDRLDLVQALGGSLQSIVRDGVTYQYVKEGIGFKANTRFYNFNGELSSLVTTVSVSGVNVKTYSYDLSDYTQNGTISLSNLLDGVVDFNSQSQRIVGNNLVLDPLPDLIVTNTLINSAGESVAEQSQTVKLVQYPYSSGDIALNVYLLNRKVAESPSFSLNLIQAYPQSFVGLKFFIFDSSHDSNNPNYSETIYAGELGCVNKMYCQKNITIDKWSFPEATTYTVVVALLLTTEPQNLDNPLTKFENTILATFTNFETGRVLQVFERRGDINALHGEYNQSEEIPLVFQARNDKLENMQNQYAVNLSVRWLDVNFGAHDISVPFYPQKFVYDSVTGYNYWFFNQVLHDDAGDLLPDGSIVYTRANVTPIRGQGQVSYFGYTLKCTTYPSDFSDGSFLMNWIGLIGDSTFGCTGISPALNPMTDANSFVGDIVAQNTAYISATYVPVSNQNESVFCWNADVNVTYAPDIGNSFMCGVLYKKSEAQIDRFDVMLGNQYSDYSKTGDNAQFIKFSIPAEQVIFNDLAMMKNALVLTHNTQGIHTYGDFFSAVIDRLLPDWRIRGNINSANFPFLPPTFSFGADVNLAEELNPNVYDGAFVFRVNGVKVVNQYDYIKEFPELETVDPKEFRTFASANGLSVPIKQTAISLFSSDLSNLQNFKVNSPLVIFEAPRNSIKSVDGNSVAISNPPTSLKFDFIVDMFSNNLTQSYRAIVPLYLSYVVGSGTPFNFNTWLPDLWNGDNGLSTNPIGFATSNWFFFFVLMVMIILGAWVIGQTRR